MVKDQIEVRKALIEGLKALKDNFDVTKHVSTEATALREDLENVRVCLKVCKGRCQDDCRRLDRLSLRIKALEDRPGHCKCSS